MLVHEPPHGHPMSAEFGGDLGQRPRPRGEPVGQVGLQIGEAELGRPGGEPLLGGVAALGGQLLRS